MRAEASSHLVNRAVTGAVTSRQLLEYPASISKQQAKEPLRSMPQGKLADANVHWPTSSVSLHEQNLVAAARVMRRGHTGEYQFEAPLHRRIRLG